jgi:hypothetical protein
MLVPPPWAFAIGLAIQSLPAGDARISLALDRDDPYRRGDIARVTLSVREPTHVLLIRVDTEGEIQILYPSEPWGGTQLTGARTIDLAGPEGRGSFVVDDYSGMGYLFAIGSSKPFDLDPIVRRDGWDYRQIAGGRIRGDPYVALTELAARIAPGAYDYDVVPYYVDRHYDFPRFVCYDCHTDVTPRAWDPYRAVCPRYRIVIYDDPYYYPYRRGAGRAVISERPIRPGPRYEFRPADGTGHFVTRAQRGQPGAAEPIHPIGEPELRRRNTESGRRTNH